MGTLDYDNQQAVAKLTPKKLVSGVVGLISLPEVCMRVSELMDDPGTSAIDIGKVISQDAALTVRLLKIVNSAFYRFPNKIETVSRAVTIVGNRELRDLVFAATVAGVFEKISSDLIDIDDFWRHGLYCGILARLISERSRRVLHSERLFIAGLMHDIGRLVIAYKLPQLARTIIKISIDQNISVVEAEQAVLGFTHSAVGAELMRVWELPKSHQLTTLCHHALENVEECELEVNIVYLANILSQLAESGMGETELLNDIDKSIWKITGIDKNDVEQLLVEAREQFIVALDLFRPKKNRLKNRFFVA